MTLHGLLLRQLKRTGLKTDALPDDLKNWEKFIEHVNTAYVEADEERYLIDRSIEISSRELLALNDKLQNAERIANLGYWTYDRSKDKVFWSKEIYRLLGFDPAETGQDFQQQLQLVHEEDRALIKTLFERSFAERKDSDEVVRIRNSTGEYRWYYVKVRPDPNDHKPSARLEGILMDITSQKEAQEREKELNKQLIMTARQAGMADVAANVLHNIGNILNSVGVSVGLLQEKLFKSRLLSGFMEVNQALKTHSNDLNKYLTEDPQGKKLLEYLNLLEKAIHDERTNMMSEFKSLMENVQHIKDVVIMQQTFSNVLGNVELISIPEQIDAAVKMIGFDSSYVIECNYEVTQPILVDKVKLLQILANLIRNAKDALIEAGGKEKKLKLITTISTTNYMQIQVIDNGIGIDPENLERIFSFGYTTKQKGHGFGLHSSAFLAKEMGGSLKVTSEGLGKGATFTLELPNVLP